MPYAARHLEQNAGMKNLSKMGMMRQIATEIYLADGLLFPENCKVKTTVDRIELLARWSYTDSPPLHIRKQTLMGCGSLLYHLKNSYALQGWSAEVRLFPKLDREDVIAYVRAGVRCLPSDKEIQPTSTALSSDQILSHGSVVIEEKVHKGKADAETTWHFRTKDDDAIAWIRTGQAYASLFRTVNQPGKLTASFPGSGLAGTSDMDSFTQLVVKYGV